MSRQITAFGGSVEQYAGDAVMVVFGGPPPPGVLSYATRARATTGAIGDARLVRDGSQPYMYQGRWGDVIRVGQEGLRTAWEILEWTPIYFISAWTGLAYLKLGRLEDARRVVSRAAARARDRARSRRPP